MGTLDKEQIEAVYKSATGTSRATICIAALSDKRGIIYHGGLPCYGSLEELYGIFNTDMFLVSLYNYGKYRNIWMRGWFFDEKSSPWMDMLKIIFKHTEFDTWNEFVDFSLNAGLFLPTELLNSYSKASIMSLAINYRNHYDPCDMGKVWDTRPDIPAAFMFWYSAIVRVGVAYNHDGILTTRDWKSFKPYTQGKQVKDFYDWKMEDFPAVREINAETAIEFGQTVMGEGEFWSSGTQAVFKTTHDGFINLELWYSKYGGMSMSTLCEERFLPNGAKTTLQAGDVQAGAIKYWDYLSEKGAA